MLNIIDTISQAGLFLSTAILAYVGYYQINKIRQQSNTDFIVRISKSPRAYALRYPADTYARPALAGHQCVLGDFPPSVPLTRNSRLFSCPPPAKGGGGIRVRWSKEFFYESEINRKLIKAIESRRPILKKHRGAFSEDDLRGYLRYFEMIERFIAAGIISFELVNEMFGVYIARAWEHQEVKNFVFRIRADKKDARYFEHFEELAKRILENEKYFRGVSTS